MDPVQELYQVPDEIVLRPERDGGIVFNSLSGQMFGVNISALKLLLRLKLEPQSFAELTDYLCNTFRLNGENREVVAQHLEVFVKNGSVRKLIKEIR